MSPTATATRPRKAGAVRAYTSRLADLPADRFFGSILWYTISGTRQAGGNTEPVRVHYDELREWLTDLGIDQVHMPPEIKKVDAFRNASSSVVREYQLPPEHGEKRFAKLHIEDVRSDSEQVIRHVVRTVRDEQREQLSLEHMATVKFIRGGRTAKGKRHSGDHIKYQILTRVRGQDREQTQELVNDFLERYDDLSSHLHAPALRGVVRSLLLSYNAVNMKSSAGLYFIHKDKWSELDQLVTLLDRIGDGCSIEEVPLIDTDEKRSSVQNALETEIEGDCKKLLSTIAELNAAGGRVKPTKYAEISAAYQEVAARVVAWSDKFEMGKGRAADALELAATSIVNLSEKIGS